MQIPVLGNEFKNWEYNGWMDIKGVSCELAVEFEDFTPSRKKDRMVTKMTHEAIEVERMVDQYSFALRFFCCRTESLPEVNIAFRREKDKVIYMKYELKNVLITSISYKADDGEPPEETLKLHYGEIHWKFRRRQADKSWTPWTHRAWSSAMAQEVQLNQQGRR